METPRLDILLYAHDGRGLGHASRTIAIGLALRRLSPELKVLFVSGCKVSQELIGNLPLDWLKLPSYETEVIDGLSRGVDGNSGFSDRELGELRGAQLAQLVTLYRPRLVLADHTPQGKHRELLPALAASRGQDCCWLLGVRGVIGAVVQAGSDMAREVFARHYQQLLWYGDPAVLGTGHQQLLRGHYGMEPVACGYVSRLRELQSWQSLPPISPKPLAGTVSIPWLGEHSILLVAALAQTLRRLGPEQGGWRIFLGGDQGEGQDSVQQHFAGMAHCRLEPLAGAGYLEALRQSKMAIIYGGYNSLMDVLALELPAVVVLRSMQDREQQLHLERLQSAAGGLLQPVAEDTADGSVLLAAINTALVHKESLNQPIELDGASRAAGLLAAMLTS